MNYHLMVDDKFIDDFISLAERVTSNNVFVFTFQPPAIHIKSNKGVYAPFWTVELEAIVSKIKPEDKVFVHWYHDAIDTVIEKLSPLTKVYLMFWGGDFLEAPANSFPYNKIHDFVYDRKTLRYVRGVFWKNFLETEKIHWIRILSLRKFGSILKSLHPVLIRYYHIFSGEMLNRQLAKRTTFLKRIDGICHWNEFDIAILKNLYSINLKQFYFIYPLGTAHITPESKPTNTGNEINIWLGNSDTDTNNHLDAFEFLKRFKNRNIKIYCPLNYEKGNYAKLVAERGKSIFGSRFEPILEFISREQYYVLMNKIHVCVMFHNRSQAGGNIVAFLKKGKKVYLKELSSIYKFYKKLGVQVESIDEFKEKSFEDFISPLSENEVNNNFTIINQTIDDSGKTFNTLKILLD